MPELQNELGPLEFELVGGQGGPETWVYGKTVLESGEVSKPLVWVNIVVL